jgi:hypothetical protein
MSHRGQGGQSRQWHLAEVQNHRRNGRILIERYHVPCQSCCRQGICLPDQWAFCAIWVFPGSNTFSDRYLPCVITVIARAEALIHPQKTGSARHMA